MFARLAAALLLAVSLFMGTMTSPYAQEDQTDSDYVVRITKLESTIRQLSGQVEELQFNTKRLEDQIKQLQQSGGGGLPAQATPQVAPKTTATPTATESGNGPLDLMSAGKGATPSAAPSGTLAAQAAAAKAAPTEPPAAPKDAKSDLVAAKVQFRGGDFAGAANALRQFLQTWPKDGGVTEATILLGDAEYRQKRYPEAAQQYLKIAQANPVNPSAPTAFAKLGDALVSMGQKPQACATFNEFGKRFPDTEASLKARVERAKKGAGC